MSRQGEVQRPAISTVRAGTVRILACAAVAVAMSACGGSSRSSTGSPFRRLEAESSILIRVVNVNFLDARLFAVRRGSRTRIGSVTGKTNAEFKVAWRFSDFLEIEIHLVGGRTCTTLPLMTDPGDIIELQIDPQNVPVRNCRNREAFYGVSAPQG